jgi:hypothetical protein
MDSDTSALNSGRSQEDDIDEKIIPAKSDTPERFPLSTSTDAATAGSVGPEIGVLNRRTENLWLLAAFWAMFLCGESRLCAIPWCDI